MGYMSGSYKQEQGIAHGVGVRITVQDYKSVHVAVVIWATLVNTQTHRFIFI